MTSVEEFIEARKSIENLAKQIAMLVEHHAVQHSRQRLDEANRQLEVLKTMVANDVQVVVATRLTRELAGLGTKVDKLAAKTPEKKASPKKKQEKTV